MSNTKKYRTNKSEMSKTGIAAKLIQQTIKKQSAMSESDKEFLRNLADCVDANFADPLFSSIHISESLCLSQRQFSRKMKQILGMDSTHFIRSVRILKAKSMISQNNVRISDIVESCGFSTANYFTRIFKKETGITPSNFKKKENI